MATENKAVTVYLPPELEQYVSGYCLQYEVTRKNKAGVRTPSLGTGIVDLLRILSATPISELPNNVPSELPDKLKEVQGDIELNLIEKLSSNVPSQLKYNVLKEIQESPGNLLSELKSSVLKELPDREKLERAIALVDEYEAVLEKVEILARHNQEMEAELMEARNKIEQEEEVSTYPEDAIKLLDEEEETKTEIEIPSTIAKLKRGTELTGKQLAELIGVDPSYISKYKSGKLTPPAWFWDNFEARGEGSKSRWARK